MMWNDVALARGTGIVLSRRVAPTASLVFILLFLLFETEFTGRRALAQCLGPEEHKVVASDAEPIDRFGDAVAVEGDVAVIGANFEDDLGETAGAAYVVRFDGATWVEQQKLRASDGSQGDVFGDSVALSGDVIVVGATGHDHAVPHAGAAYVFRYDGMMWVEEQKLVASDAAQDDAFGSTVSASGDVIVVGAWSNDAAGPTSGAAYVYRYDGTMWVEEQKLVAGDARRWERYGTSVAVDGDVIVIGAPHDTQGGVIRSGSAYLYRHDGTTWVGEQKLVADDASEEAEFGDAVAVSGDVILVGARQSSSVFRLPGAAYAYRFDGNTWVQEQKLLASDGVGLDEFGGSVSVSGDMAIIGAMRDGHEGVASGSAYVFRYDGTVWLEDEKLVPQDGDVEDLFGRAVSVNGRTAIVGSLFDDDGGNASGSAYIYAEKVELRCRRGSVSRGVAANPADVLTIQGETGCCCGERIVSIALDEPIEIAMAAPPAGPVPAVFALYVWFGSPDPSNDYPQPFGLGTTCLPTFLTIDIPKPARIFNNAGHRALLGEPDHPSSPAPSTVVSRPQGVSTPATATLQGLIVDDGSAGALPGSVTNAIVLEIQ